MCNMLYITNKGKILDTADTLDEAETKVLEFRRKGIMDMIYVTEGTPFTGWKPNIQELRGDLKCNLKSIINY